MTTWLLQRLLWLLATLLGITFVTFLVLDQAPVDRAELEAARVATDQGYADARSREAAILRLRVRYGMVDPVTLEPAPVWRRYTAWLQNAALLRFGGPGGDHDALWRRLAQALPVTVWLGGLALGVAVVAGVAIGGWLGFRVGTRADRLVSALLLVGAGLPEFLLATLLLLGFAVVWLQWFPASGLRSPGAESWSFGRQLADFAWHLVLPVSVMVIGPLTLVARFVRDAVANTLQQPVVANLRALGVEEVVVGWRVLRHACTPLATLAGSLLPMLVGGSIVVESLFALDGLGHLAFLAVTTQDQPLLMAIVVIVSVVTLASLVLSDVLHRWVDPRVRWQS
jgi:peptide/nickel transport system permease protein